MLNKLLRNLEDDLNELYELAKLEENYGRKEDLFSKYFEECEKLKKFLNAKLIYTKQVKWFLETKFFILMSCKPESFDTTPLELYQQMVLKTNISKKEIFQKHLKILLDEKTAKNKELPSFPFRDFFPILSTIRESSSPQISFSPKLTVFKRKKWTPHPISPLALEGNSLSDEVESQREKSLELKP